MMKKGGERMGWIQKLHETYENCYELIDKEEDNTLLPVAHTVLQAHIEVIINEKSEFVSARALVDKDDKKTILPCTVDSESRTSGPGAHPLFDKLQYIAGDYVKYGGTKKHYYDIYMKQLEDWCNSEYGHDKVRILYNYLMKGTLIEDLVNHRVLHCDENDHLLSKWNGPKDETPLIFKALSNQSDSFVRFQVIGVDDISALNLDPDVQKSYISYYLSKGENMDLCYATGEITMCTDKHPKFIRFPGDGAKLISSNDSSNFSYRGRFTDSKHALRISYEVSQKAHNALKWLIQKQGIMVGGEVYLVWGTNNERIPIIDSDTADLLGYNEQEEFVINTEQEFASRLKQAIKGYSVELDHKSSVVIMCLDAPSEGRLSIKYYQELPGDEFLSRIEHWHSTCIWRHAYKKKGYMVRFIGAPAFRDIINAVYGENIGENHEKAVMERLLHCMLRQEPLPVDIVRMAVYRASNPVAMEPWQWEKALSIACALYNKYKEKERYDMALDENLNHRDYLYGRLLAVADHIENLTFDKWGERPTTAKRYMQAFAQRPFKTWTLIAQNLVPYQSKLGPKANWYNDLISYIHSKFDINDFQDDSPLSGLYLLGFHSQRYEFLKGLRKKDENAKNDENNN
jgi:CRISPR-associated protein Csd1